MVVTLTAGPIGLRPGTERASPRGGRLAACRGEVKRGSRRSCPGEAGRVANALVANLRHDEAELLHELSQNLGLYSHLLSRVLPREVVVDLEQPSRPAAEVGA